MKPYYDKDGITIYCGDCLEVMPGLDGPFDAIIADLPYGTTACDWDTVIPLDALWVEYKRLIKERGAVVLFGSQPFTTMLINAAGFDWFKYRWIWDKVMAANYPNANKMPLIIDDDICIFSKGGASNGSKIEMIYNPIMTKRETPRKAVLNKGLENVKNPKYHHFIGREMLKVLYTEKYPKSILQFSNAGQSGKTHPTQKPVALLSYLIRTYTNPGEIILDNTIGSGTTLVAAQNEGRKAVGIELSEKYCKIAVDRLRQPSFFSIPNQDKKEDEYKQMDITIK